ncbi:MAG: UDP-4-amino-4,6-dideoxy-N-acetyl-beta-L-altrosamine transaminase [Nitrospiraceae bacterium]|nr:UDP-4-amino-4,6-dideoxy-N-acetyl-beta-L-altrosamine transaminase [Nitrospiraceae bacterium]
MVLPYSRQFIDDGDIKAVTDVLRSDFITQGPKIEEFETALAEYCGAAHAVIFSSGTAALHAACEVAGVGAGDEIVTTPLTFVATANVSLYVGAKPVFIDVECDTGNIDANLIEHAITPCTKAIIPVHFAGHPAAMEQVFDLAQKQGLVIIEDACHALGARYLLSRAKEHRGGERAEWVRIGKCALSDMTVFSFHPVKHITTGEGGAVLTNDKSYYDRLLMFRTHGITRTEFTREPDGPWYYEMHLLGFNYRMTDLQAALGISQLRKIERFIERRREIAGIYNRKFHSNPFFDVPAEKDYAYSAYHLYPIRLKEGYAVKKAAIVSELRRRGLGVQVHYIPVYLQPFYQQLGYEKALCPVSEAFYRSEISIPIYPAMNDDEVCFVTETLVRVFEDFA